MQFVFREGTSKAGEKYKVGKKMTDIMLEILNLDKKEIITADAISNQEFSEVGILISFQSNIFIEVELFVSS